MSEDSNSTVLARGSLFSIKFSHQNDSSLKMCCKHQLLRAFPIQSGCRTSAAKFERLLLDSTKKTHKKELSCLVCLLSKNGNFTGIGGNHFHDILNTMMTISCWLQTTTTTARSNIPVSLGRPLSEYVNVNGVNASGALSSARSYNGSTDSYAHRAYDPTDGAYWCACVGSHSSV